MDTIFAALLAVPMGATVAWMVAFPVMLILALGRATRDPCRALTVVCPLHDAAADDAAAVCILDEGRVGLARSQAR